MTIDNKVNAKDMIKFQEKWHPLYMACDLHNIIGLPGREAYKIAKQYEDIYRLVQQYYVDNK